MTNSKKFCLGTTDLHGEKQTLSRYTQYNNYNNMMIEDNGPGLLIPLTQNEVLFC